MDKIALDKIIKKIVFPKYPSIKDCEIIVHTYRPPIGDGKKIGYERFRVNYFLTPDKDGTFTVTDDIKKIEDLTKTLFNMLGPKNYQSLDGVEFYSYEDNNVLDKVIKKNVLPKYPWIVDYKISSAIEGEWGVDRKTYYYVNYFINPEWRKNNDDEVLLNDMKKVEDITKTLYKSLGFDENNKLGSVDFFVHGQS